MFGTAAPPGGSHGRVLTRTLGMQQLDFVPSSCSTVLSSRFPSILHHCTECEHTGVPTRNESILLACLGPPTSHATIFTAPAPAPAPAPPPLTTITL
eukprot:116811-Hanusia_phi.AAC.1